MSDFSRFMKENKIKKENKSYVATTSLTDENGNPLVWAFKPISTAQHEAIRESCMEQQATIKSKKDIPMPKFNSSKYMAKLVCASCIEPNLNDKALQDSYGVMTPEELIKEMVDSPGEYSDLCDFVQGLSGFDVTLDDKVEEAKN